MRAERKALAHKTRPATSGREPSSSVVTVGIGREEALEASNLGVKHPAAA